MSRMLPDTLIEIYDEEPIHNILAAAQFKPRNLVFIGTRKLKSKRIKSSIITALRYLGVESKCFFYSTDMSSLDSVTGELMTVLDSFGECAVEITGGNEVALVAAGMLAKQRGLPLFRYDRFTRSYCNIYGCEAAEGPLDLPDFNINAVLAMAGGAMKSHGHLCVDTLDGETEGDIFKIWTIYKKHHSKWHKTVGYLQQLSKKHDSDTLKFSGSSVLYGTESISGADLAVLGELSDAGIIRNYQNNGGRIGFTFKSSLMKSCLCDVGICLELYVFAVARRMGIYSDVAISVVIDWDGDLDARLNTINEIDVFAVCGFTPLFISCKSGPPNVTVLNEIKTLATRFGGEFAKPVLVTMADVRSRDRYLAKRAEDMGVELIDRSDLVSERLSKQLYKISQA